MPRFLLLDCDNTLYPESLGVEAIVSGRMREFAKSWTGIPDAELDARRAEGFRKWGTTLSWLMHEMGFDDAEGYFARVHTGDELEALAPDPELAELLAALPMHKAILTNAPAEHARRVAGRLGVEGAFEAFYDIRFSRFRGKPHKEAFERALAALGARAEEAIFVDDQPVAVRAFMALGGEAWLVDETGRHEGKGLKSVASIKELLRRLAAA
jgi:putative hydrolase of the HAD superfamily